jgi:hypothetical protein
VGTAITIDLIQTGIYAAIALGGFLISHFFGPKPAPTPTAPQPSAPLPGPTGNPLLDRILPIFEQELLKVLQAAASRLINPQQMPSAAPVAVQPVK